MLHKRILFTTLIIILSLALSRCGTSTPQTVKIAMSAPLGRPVGQLMVNGVQLALDEAGGKAGDIPVELVVFSTSEEGGNPVSNDLEREVAQKAAADPDIVAYIGPLSSGQAKESIPVLNQAGITQIAFTTSWPGLTKAGYSVGEPGKYYPTGQRTFFRVVPSDDLQAAAAARWAKSLGFEKVYLVDDQSNFGQGLTGIFEVTAVDADIEVKRESFDESTATQKDYAAIAAHVVDAQPDAVYFGGGGVTAIPFLRELWELDPDVQVIGADPFVSGIDDLKTEFGIKQLAGLYSTDLGVPVSKLDTDEGKAFLAKYQKTYGSEGEPPSFTAGAYEAMNVLLHAIEQAKEPTREGILAAMKNLGDYSGVYGTWRFDQAGDISVLVISGKQLQENGEWSLVEVLK